MGRYYLPPIGDEILQGDILDGVPAAFVRPGPTRVIRMGKTKGDYQFVTVHTEANPPHDGMKLSMESGGDDVIVHGYLERAMLLTHECEIENDDRARTVAMIRPISHLDAETAEKLFSDDPDALYTRFPLPAQADEPMMERSFVDFMRLTTVHPKVLEECRRVASVPDEVRHAVATAFYEFLFRRLP